MKILYHGPMGSSNRSLWLGVTRERPAHSLVRWTSWFMCSMPWSVGLLSVIGCWKEIEQARIRVVGLVKRKRWETKPLLAIVKVKGEENGSYVTTSTTFLKNNALFQTQNKQFIYIMIERKRGRNTITQVCIFNCITKLVMTPENCPT